MTLKLFPYQAPAGEATGGEGAPPAAAAADNDAPLPASGEAQDVQWDEFADDGPEGFVSPATDDPPAAPSAPAAPAQPAATAQPAEPAAAAAPAQPAAPQPPATAPAQPAQPAQPTAEQLAARDAAVKEARAKMHGALAEIYTNELDDDTKAALLADPATVMPKLLAQAALDGANMAVQQILPMLPQVIGHTTAQQQGAMRAWQEFDTAAPDLAKPEYRQAVAAAINFVKGSGVRYASKQEAIAAVARTTRAMLGIADPGAQAAQPATQPAAAPVAPHSPVARGAARQPASRAKSDNPWLEMLDD